MSFNDRDRASQSRTQLAYNTKTTKRHLDLHKTIPCNILVASLVRAGYYVVPIDILAAAMMGCPVGGYCQLYFLNTLINESISLDYVMLARWSEQLCPVITY